MAVRGKIEIAETLWFGAKAPLILRASYATIGAVPFKSTFEQDDQGSREPRLTTQIRGRVLLWLELRVIHSPAAAGIPGLEPQSMRRLGRAGLQEDLRPDC
jgi:hypothetical protein